MSAQQNLIFTRSGWRSLAASSLLSAAALLAACGQSSAPPANSNAPAADASKPADNSKQLSVAVPTVERGLAPIRSWSTMIAVVRPSSRSTSGRARLGMNP